MYIEEKVTDSARLDNDLKEYVPKSPGYSENIYRVIFSYFFFYSKVTLHEGQLISICSTLRGQREMQENVISKQDLGDREKGKKKENGI